MVALAQKMHFKLMTQREEVDVAHEKREIHELRNCAERD